MGKPFKSHYVTTRSLILESRLVGESDRLVCVLTEDIGKIRAKAPGAEKINARLLSATEPFVESDITFYENSNGSPVLKITGGVMVRAFHGLKGQIERFLTASKVLEVTGMLLPERQPSEKKYALAIRTLELLETAEKCNRVYLAFVLRFLKLCGWGLELVRCVNCGGAPAPYFSVREKGVLCEKCAVAKNSDGDFIVSDSNGTISLLRKLATSPGSELDTLSVDSGAGNEVENIVGLYLSEYLPRKMGSGLDSILYPTPDITFHI